VVGVLVGVEGVLQGEAELAQQRQIPLVLLEHGVDEQRLAAHRIGEQVRVGGGLGVEELSKEHDGQ